MDQAQRTAPGQPLDELIAERFMGWHKGKGGAVNWPGAESSAYWYSADGGRHHPCIRDDFANMWPWSPSTDIADAWMVVEWLKAQGCHLELRWVHDWTCVLIGERSASADTAPMAICLAALKSIGVKVE